MKAFEQLLKAVPSIFPREVAEPTGDWVGSQGLNKGEFIYHTRCDDKAKHYISFVPKDITREDGLLRIDKGVFSTDLPNPALNPIMIRVRINGYAELDSNGCFKLELNADLEVIGMEEMDMPYLLSMLLSYEE